MKAIVFDVNETLLDLRAMRPRFEELFGSADLTSTWFTRLLAEAFIATLTDRYRPFDDLGVEALHLVASRAGTPVSDAGARYVVDGMRRLPPHPDVRPALALLRDHGFRVATLTNSPPDLLADQLADAGIADLFDATMSVDAVGRFKPHPDTYRYAAGHLGVAVGEMRLVAAHDWDVTGAIRAGAAAAFVERPGMTLSSAGETPDIIAPDLEAVAAAIVRADG